MNFGMEEKSNMLVDLKQQTSLMNRIQELTSLCSHRKTAVVQLIEDGIGDRMWTFKAATAPNTAPAPVPVLTTATDHAHATCIIQ